MREQKKVVVVGLGEVGRPLLEIVSTCHHAIGVDISPSSEQIGKVDVLHVCFPFDIHDFQAFRPRYALGSLADFFQIHAETPRPTPDKCSVQPAATKKWACAHHRVRPVSERNESIFPQQGKSKVPEGLPLFAQVSNSDLWRNSPTSNIFPSPASGVRNFLPSPVAQASYRPRRLLAIFTKSWNYHGWEIPLCP